MDSQAHRPTWLIGCLLTLTVLAFGSACSPPVEAPTQFDELCSFIYKHADDEDPQALADGVVNLQNWLKSRRDEVREGYMVDNLDPEVVKTLDGQDHDLTDLLGVAFATQFTSTLDQRWRSASPTTRRCRRPTLENHDRTNDDGGVLPR